MTLGSAGGAVLNALQSRVHDGGTEPLSYLKRQGSISGLQSLRRPHRTERQHRASHGARNIC